MHMSIYAAAAAAFAITQASKGQVMMPRHHHPRCICHGHCPICPPLSRCQCAATAQNHGGDEDTDGNSDGGGTDNNQQSTKSSDGNGDRNGDDDRNNDDNGTKATAAAEVR